MNHRKPPERRTYLQDRLDILINKQRMGTATFNELTELDDIVNRDPVILKRIILENMLPDEPDQPDEPGDSLNQPVKPLIRQSLLNRIKGLISRIFILPVTLIKSKILASFMNQALPI